ncbi:MAG: hypothetical protein IKG89_06785 [Oscillospiraceae bacterium]|nr:hypothetical protein [Oscillospiraceae bacterium]
MEDRSSPMLTLLRRKDWGDEQPRVDALLASPYGSALLKALKALKRDVLYQSHVHGLGHIERTMVHGAMCAMAEELDEADTALLMDMCSYHDTGRESDWLDNAHGYRSSLKLAELTGRDGEDLKLMMAGVEAHSIGDKYMGDVIRKHAPADPERGLRLARMLKDADALDRVRIRDLNPKYLRFGSSRGRVRFAQLLFDRYRAIQGEWGVRQEEDGFDLGVIQALKQFVGDCFAQQKPCGETALLALDKLIREEHARDLIPPAAEGQPQLRPVGGGPPVLRGGLPQGGGRGPAQRLHDPVQEPVRLLEMRRDEAGGGLRRLRRGRHPFRPPVLPGSAEGPRER